MRVEYVFVTCLEPEYLLMVGSDLITRVYSSFIIDPGAQRTISSFLDNYDEGDEDVRTLTKYIMCTYCHLRGKDFARKMMSRDTKSNEQTTCQTQAILSQKKIYGIKTEQTNETKIDGSKYTVDDTVDSQLFQGVVHNLSILDETSNEMENNLLE